MARVKPSFSMSIILIVTLVISFMESGLTLNCYTCDSRTSKTCELAPTKEELMTCEDTPETIPSTPSIIASTSSEIGGTTTTEPVPETSKPTPEAGTTQPTTGTTQPTTGTENPETTSATGSPITAAETESSEPTIPTTVQSTSGNKTKSSKGSKKADSGVDDPRISKSKSDNLETSSSSKNKESSDTKQYSHDDSEGEKVDAETISSISSSNSIQDRFRRSVFRADEDDFMCVKLIGAEGDKKVVIRKCVKKSPMMCAVSDLSSVTQCSACNTDACNSLGISISFGIMSMFLPIATIALFAR